MLANQKNGWYLKIQSKGGTERLYENLVQKLDKNDLLGINLIINHLSQELLKSDQINILWNHHNTDQPPIQVYRNKELLKQIQYFVYVSNWQYDKYRYHFQIPENRSLVIKNAIQPIELKRKTQ